MATDPHDLAEELSDAALLSSMTRGSRDALAKLYARHAPTLLALGRAILGDPAEAEDLVHDVFLEAWRQATTYDEVRGSVKIWLSMKTRSRALDRIKSRRRRRDVLASDGVSALTHSHQSSSADGDFADRRSLLGALGGIEETQREVLELGYFADLSATEIAERLNLPLGTVKSRTRAALATLRTIFGNKP